jgi:hypothetical protein
MGNGSAKRIEGLAARDDIILPHHAPIWRD